MRCPGRCLHQQKAESVFGCGEEKGLKLWAEAYFRHAYLIQENKLSNAFYVEGENAIELIHYSTHPLEKIVVTLDKKGLQQKQH